MSKPIQINQAPFVPDSETLLPDDELDALSEVLDADIDSAIDAWKANPPAADFDGLLEAVSDAQF